MGVLRPECYKADWCIVTELGQRSNIKMPASETFVVLHPLLGNNVASTNAQGKQNQGMCFDFKSFLRRQPDSFINYAILKDC